MMRFSLDSTSRNGRYAPNSCTDLNRQRRRERTVARAVSHAVEVLEGRRMLATVGGNQIAVFDGADGPTRIAITGRATFNFVGAVRDSGAPRLADIPMTIYDTGGRVIRENLGGFGGRDGIAPIDEVIDPDPSDNSNGAEALAADNRGRTYGVNQAGFGVSVLRYNFATNGVPNVEDANIGPEMLALVQSEINADAAAGDLTQIIGADFDPSADNGVDQNLMYFAANYQLLFANGQNTTERVVVPVMFTYNVSTHAVAIIRGEFGWRNEEDTVRVDDFAFVNNSRIAFFAEIERGDNGGGGGDDEVQARLYVTDSDFIDDTSPQLLRVGPNEDNGDLPEPIERLASIEFIPGTNVLLAIEPDGEPTNDADNGELPVYEDANSRLVRFNMPASFAGRGVDSGPVDDPDNDPAGFAGLGDNVLDLTWNPRLEQQLFEPGKRGTLLGVDTAQGTIVGIEQRLRFQTPDLYAVYGRNVSANTTVAISAFTPLTLDTNPEFSNAELFGGIMNPYGAGSGSIQSGMLPVGTLIPLGAGVGSLYLGIRTPNQAGDLVNPVLSLAKSTGTGSTFGIDLPNSVRPGVFVSGTMKDFLFAGTITGSVKMSGSVDTFYAGNVLTGDIVNGSENLNDNFYVDGDLRNLVITGGIGAPAAGTQAAFLPNTDLRVNGRVQQIKTGTTWRAALDVNGSTSERTISTAVDELENYSNQANAAGLLFEGTRLQQSGLKPTTSTSGILNAISDNDTFETAQVLGSYTSRARGKGQQVTVAGSLNPVIGDEIDYYGIPVLAGKKFVVSLTTEGLESGPFTGRVQIIDPDGRVYATNDSNQNQAAFTAGAISVTTDKPGVWRVAVQAAGTYQYNLMVDNIGQMAIGGLVSLGNVFVSNDDMGVRVRNNDLGAILAADALEGTGLTTELGTANGFLNPIQSDKGSIRSLEGSSISGGSDTVVSNIPVFLAPKGSIGLIRAETFSYFNLLGANVLTGRPADRLTIGGDYQVIEAGGDFSAVLSANGGIGVIRVGSYASTLAIPGYVEINADDTGKAELGLIDVVGDLGTLAGGGPAMYTGDGGNIRYLRVGGEVYRDPFFGGGNTNVLTGSDRAVTVRDDSGTNVRITPVQTSITTSTTPTGTATTSDGGLFGGGFINDPFGGASSSVSPTTASFNNPFGSGAVPTANIIGDVQIATYGVRSGGSVIYNVLSTTGVAISTVGSRLGGGGAVADITTLRTGATGSAVVVTPETRTVTDPVTGLPVVIDATTLEPSERAPLSLAAGQTLDVIVNGSGTVNLFEIGATSGDTGGLGAAGTITNTATYTRIINNTSGEIVNVAAASIGRLEAARVGFASPVAGVKIEGLTPLTGIGAAYPFNGARNGIRVGDAIDIISRGAIGNILATGEIGNVIANSGDKNDKSQWEGIVGPIVSQASIRRVDIGEGLQSSGSGDTSFGGLYAGTDIGLITNLNGEGDIRGDVLAGDYIQGIRLTGGASIFNADIIQSNDDLDDLGFTVGQENSSIVSEVVSTDPAVLFGIGDIEVSGNGGIMSSRIVAGRLGKVTVSDDGFGVFTSSFIANGSATMDGLEAGGLGIRGTTFSGGGFVGDIVATGEGKVRRLTEFAKVARGSESKDGLDEKTGIEANASTDLYLYLGATTKLNKITGVTDDGVIEDSILQANRSIDSVRAWEIRSRALTGARPRDETYPMQINFADEVGEISASRNINGARIVGGQVGSISAGRDILQFQLQATSGVESITAGRNVLGTARFNITGEGSLDTFQANGNMNGVLFAAQGIRQMIIKGDVGSEGTDGGIRSGTGINVLKIGGSLVRSAYIRAGSTIKELVIDGDIGEDARLRATSFGKIKIGGTTFGDIIRG